MLMNCTFPELFKQITALHPKSPALITEHSVQSFEMINIYNVLIIHGIIEFDIQGSVFEVSNFFGRIGYTIDGPLFLLSAMSPRKAPWLARAF